jgi:tetratricopeptide (TPR) repeat protein
MTEPSGRDSPDVDAFSILAYGSSSIEREHVRRSLGLPEDCDDERFAQALVSLAASAALPAAHPLSSSAPPRSSRVPVRAPRSSYMLRPAPQEAVPGLGVKDLSDLRTLLLILRAGGLFQRRAAVRRIGELLLGPTPLAAEPRRHALDALRSQRNYDLTYETSRVLASLPGGESRAARAEQRVRQELAARLQLKVLEFWEGQHHREPLCELSAEERAMLLPHARELSDVTIRHVSALLEDTAGQVSETELRVILTSLEQAGDPRLFPALRTLFAAQPATLFEPCIQALASIEDARVPGLLAEGFERTARAADRLLLAAALGRYGDTRGLGYARSVLLERDSALLGTAIEALTELGGTDDVQRLLDLLDQSNPSLLRSTVIALGRIGDGRALLPLAELRARVQPSALRADIEDAESAIAARSELLGEATPGNESLALRWDTRRMVAIARTRDPALLRLRALLYHGLAVFCLVFGASGRANSLFEAAAALRAGWLSPVRSLALLHARRRDVASSLAAFRRALDIDRAALEADPHAISVLAMTFLRRAEWMEREGRLDIARSLVDEALSYDLRRASAQARLALGERREAHSAREPR